MYTTFGLTLFRLFTLLRHLDRPLLASRRIL